MRRVLFCARALASALGAAVAPAPPPASAQAPPAPLGLRSAPWEPVPTKQTPPAPVLLTQSRRRRRAFYLAARERVPDYQPFVPKGHRYNRSARRHARNNWQRSGHN